MDLPVDMVLKRIMVVPPSERVPGAGAARHDPRLLRSLQLVHRRLSAKVAESTSSTAESDKMSYERRFL